jgi:acetyl-CoA carboxylase biotin carboxyl carrier protein
MNQKEIERLIQVLVGTDIEEFEITRGEDRLHIRRRLAGPSPFLHHGIEPHGFPGAIPGAPGTAAPEPAPAEPLGTIIRSPLVGTFYRASSPDAKAFVEVGDIVARGQVLCIIEAMKLMNEIEAECDGKVTSIMAENGRPVEYGEPLFELGPVE